MRVKNWIKSLFKKKPQPISKINLDKGDCWVVNGLKNTQTKYPPLRIKIKDYSAIERDPKKALNFIFGKEEILEILEKYTQAPKVVHSVLAALIIRKTSSGYFLARIDGRALTHKQINQILGL